MTSNQNNKRDHSGVRLPLWALALLIVTALIVIGILSVTIFNTVSSAAAEWEVTNPDFGEVAEPLPNAAITITQPANAVAQPEEPPPLISTDALQAWEGNERVSILMLGIDVRCDEEGPTHTDSMMVVTIDPVALSAAVLSLPRDLWVEIPDYGTDRINQAHYIGQAYEYPGGGPGLAVETVESALGIEIDYYAAINFNAFIEVVDLIGGIEIEVTETIDDPDYPDNCYGFDPFFIEPGIHQMDGATALKYARTRATFGGDVDRAGRQQAVVLAARNQVMDLNKMPQLIAQSPLLWQTLQKNLRTNLSLDEALQLALLAQDIPEDRIQTAVIDYNYVYNETTPDGRQVLVPNREALRQLRNDLFSPPIVPTPAIENLPALAADENARVVLMNGTAVFGLAGDTETYLKEQNVNVVGVGNADAATYRTSQIISYGDFPYTAQYLTQLMNIPPLNINDGNDPEGDYDLLVIIGDDWRTPTNDN